MKIENKILMVGGSIVGTLFIFIVFVILTAPSNPVDVGVLDNVCKELYNDTGAEFYEQSTLSYEFGCKIDNRVIFTYKDME